MSHPFGKLLIQDVIDEYGGDPDEQSALNAVYLLAYYDSIASGVQPKGHPMLSGTTRSTTSSAAMTRSSPAS